MRLAYPVVLLVLFLLVGGAWFSMHVGSDPSTEAQTFMTDIQEGRVVHAVKQFGSNVCHCPAKGGWVSYLIYQSGQEHNLAFMLGHPAQLGAPHAAPVATDRPALVPWERPEDYVVDYPVHFEKTIYQPYFLPLPLAYGKNMDLKEFQEFLKDPDKDAWKGFTLRLRPGLAAGVINAPKITVPQEMKDDFVSYRRVQEQMARSSQSDPKADYIKETAIKVAAGKTANSNGVRSNSVSEGKKASEGTAQNSGSDDSEVSEEYMRKMFGAEATEYLIPKDAGNVIGADGKPLSQEDVAAKLPRLIDMVLRLHVVRRDKLQPWTIYHFAVEHPVLVTPDGVELALTHHQRPRSESTPPKTNKAHE
jgi:hypothetical protein